MIHLFSELSKKKKNIYYLTYRKFEIKYNKIYFITKNKS